MSHPIVGISDHNGFFKAVLRPVQQGHNPEHASLCFAEQPCFKRNEVSLSFRYHNFTPPDAYLCGLLNECFPAVP